MKKIALLLACMLMSSTLYADNMLDSSVLQDITNTKNSTANLYAVSEIDAEGRGNYVLEIMLDKWVEDAEVVFTVHGFFYDEDLPFYDEIRSGIKTEIYDYKGHGKIPGVVGGEVWHNLDCEVNELLSPRRMYAWEVYSVELGPNTNNNTITIPLVITGTRDPRFKGEVYIEVEGDIVNHSEKEILNDSNENNQGLTSREAGIFSREEFLLEKALPISEQENRRKVAKAEFEEEREGKHFKQVTFTVGSKSYMRNGETQQIEGKAPYLKNGTMMVPLDDIGVALQLNFSTFYSIAADMHAISLRNKDKELWFNRQNKNVIAPVDPKHPDKPREIVGRLSEVPENLAISIPGSQFKYGLDYLPVASVAKLFGYKVSWDQVTQTVTLTP